MDELKNLRGLVATVVLTGSVMEEFAACLMEARAHCITNGYTSIEWLTFPAQLVEAGRDTVLEHARDQNYDFAILIDADAVFNADLITAMLMSAFVTAADSDALGAYAQLKHDPYLPVIDTGTGTWEPHFPGEGILPCIRTGGHCILVKASAWQRMPQPWFRTRRTMKPMDALREVDNYARIKNDGKNPLDTADWRLLMEKASEEFGGVIASVGEDSGFCDSLLAHGGKLYVDCNIVTGHIAKKTIRAQDLREAMKSRQRKLGLSVGVML